MVRLSMLLAARRGEATNLTGALRSVMAQAMRVRGCLGCDLSADLTNPDGVHYVERWATELELRERIRSPQFMRLIAVVETSATPPRFDIEFVTSSRGIEYLGEVLNGA